MSTAMGELSNEGRSIAIVGEQIMGGRIYKFGNTVERKNAVLLIL
jgi:hypothetical protein